MARLLLRSMPYHESRSAMPMVMSTRQAAERLDVPFSTLRQWIATVPIPLTRDAAGNFQITDADLETLATVRDMRASGQTLQQVRERLNQQEPQQRASERSIERGPDREDTASNATVNALLEELIPAMTQALVPTVTRAVLEDTQRAERFGQFAHRVGELEATLRERDRELSEARSQIALLPGPDRLADLERQNALQALELEHRTRELTELRERLTRRPWFAFWR